MDDRLVGADRQRDAAAAVTDEGAMMGGGSRTWAVICRLGVRQGSAEPATDHQDEQEGDQEKGEADGEAFRGRLSPHRGARGSLKPTSAAAPERPSPDSALRSRRPALDITIRNAVISNAGKQPHMRGDCTGRCVGYLLAANTACLLMA